VKSISDGKHELIRHQFLIFDIDSINAEPIYKTSILSELDALSTQKGCYLDPNIVSLGMFYTMKANALKQLKPK
jgi:hypothetical protein